MKIRKRLEKWKLCVSSEHTGTFRGERQKRELFALKWISFCLVVVELFMLMQSCIRYRAEAWNGRQLSYTLLYLILFFFMFAFWGFYTYHSEKTIVRREIVVLYLNGILLWNIMITFLDQKNYPTAIAYILTVLVIAFWGVTDVGIVLVSYFVMQTFFVICLPFVQPDSQIRYTEIINTSITVLLGILTLLLTNRNRVIDFENRMIIMEKNWKLDEILHKLAEANKKLKEQVDTDQLTGLFNRYYFERNIEEVFQEADRMHQSLCLAVADIDHFKEVNDTWGHPVGDEVLVEIADYIKNTIPGKEKLARLGGEELIILMPDTGAEEARVMLEKLRSGLARQKHRHTGQVTLSFGVAQKKDGENYTSLYRRADESLYMAKEAGRNCVICHDLMEERSFISVKFIWKEEWECGSEKLDRQHKGLINQVNVLLIHLLDQNDSAKAREDLISLYQNLTDHFHYEEEVMAQINYPELETHRDIHLDLTEKTERLLISFDEGQLKSSRTIVFMMDDVVREHIIQEDTKFFPFLQKDNKPDL